MELKGKTVTVVGLGNSGLNAATLLCSIGASVRVTEIRDNPVVRDSKKLLESKGASVEVGAHTRPFIDGSDLVVVSPGVEGSSPALKWAAEGRVPVIGETELGYRFCRGRIIAVTGTNGKSTVTTMIGQMLKDAGGDTVVCGNIGNSLCGEIEKIGPQTDVVLEVSSFQLERIESFKPCIALILNITDDHMDRYTKFDDYFNEKLKIFANQTEDNHLILNYDAANIRDLGEKARSGVLYFSRNGIVGGSYVKNGCIVCDTGSGPHHVCSVEEVPLKGLHNLENVLASSLAAFLAGASGESMRRSIMSFKALAHRFETVAVIEGIEFIDDSKGTTVDSTYRALEACDKPVILIAGGKDKHSDYRYVKEMVAKRVKSAILIGEAKRAIKAALEGSCETYEAIDLPAAVGRARKLAKPGMLVLLSPMCSSFDMFRDYKERGEVFRRAVMELITVSKDTRAA